MKPGSAGFQFCSLGSDNPTHDPTGWSSQNHMSISFVSESVGNAVRSNISAHSSQAAREITGPVLDSWPDDDVAHWSAGWY